MNAHNQQFLEIQEAENIDSVIFTTQPPLFHLDNGREILTALNAVQAEIVELGGISKVRDTNSTNAAFKFKFRGIDDMYNVISSLLVKHKIVIIPHLERAQCTKHTTKKGDITFKTHVIMRYSLFSCVDGSYIESCVIGESNDTTDKSGAKALSVAQKYMFIQTFSIPTASSPSDEQNSSRQWGQQPDHQNHKPNNSERTVKTIQYASLKFKNHVDEFMRKNGNRLCDVVKSMNLDMESLTHENLKKIAFDFDLFLKNQPPQESPQTPQAPQQNI